jgi:hypothetical protein
VSGQEGHFTWVVPDGWLPPKGGEGDMVNHESLMIMNTSDRVAEIKMDIYFEDKEPALGLPLTVGARRIKSFRLDMPEQIGFEIPRATQYALRIRSSVKVIAQYGRMDVRQANLAYYGTMACPVD